MSSSVRTRACLLGGATLLAALVQVPSAAAASADLAYTCDWSVGATDGTGDATARFDSAIGADVVVEVGEDVAIDPFTGTVTLPEAFTDALRDAGVTEVDGARPAETGDAPGLLLTAVAESEDLYPVELTFQPTSVPSNATLVIDLDGEGGSVFAGAEGTNTLVADDLVLELGTGDDGPEARMSCSLSDEGDATVDTFEAVAAATPTASPTASPVRPSVVQTDFAEEEGPGSLPLAAGGVLAAAVLALGLRRLARRTATRRH